MDRTWTRGMLTGAILAPQAMQRHRAAWDDLAARALEPSLFNDPLFLHPAALHLPGWRSPRFLLAWDAGEPARLLGLCCIAPALPMIPAAAWLHPQATAAFPLLDAARPHEAFDALLRLTAGFGRRAGLLMQGLPENGPTLALLRCRSEWCVVPIETRGRAVMRSHGATPTKSSKELRRQARRLGEQGTLAITVSGRSEAIEGFLALEAAGWKGRRATALNAEPARARFARAMLHGMAAAGRLQVHGLTLDGHRIAGGLVLRCGRQAYFWKTAFDEGFARFSPGAQLAVAIGATQANDPGLALTDSCAIPNHSMIDRLWPDRMTVVDLLVARQPGLSLGGHLALAMRSARERLRGWAKVLRASRLRRLKRAPPSS